MCKKGPRQLPGGFQIDGAKTNQQPYLQKTTRIPFAKIRFDLPFTFQSPVAMVFIHLAIVAILHESWPQVRSMTFMINDHDVCVFIKQQCPVTYPTIVSFGYKNCGHRIATVDTEIMESFEHFNSSFLPIPKPVVSFSPKCSLGKYGLELTEKAVNRTGD